MPRFGVLVLVVCVGGVLAAGAVGFFSRPSRRGRGATIAVRSLRSDVPSSSRCRLPAAASDSSGASTPRAPRALATPGSRVEVPIRCWGEGAWRVLRGWFSLEDLARTQIWPRGRPYLHRGFALRDAAVLVGGARSKGSFVVLGRFFLNGLAQDADVLAKALLPIKRATVSASKGKRHWRSVPALLPTSRAIVSMPSRARSS